MGTLGTDKKFTGQCLDQDGLYFYNARYYDAGIGRFISADSIVPNLANPQSLNRYSYCYNNPLVYTDPTGHWGWSNIWKWGSDHIVEPVTETVSDVMDFGGHWVGMCTSTPNPAAYEQAKKDPYNIVGQWDAATGGTLSQAEGALNALGRTLVCTQTEDSVAAAYASGDQGAITKAYGFTASEATINIATIVLTAGAGWEASAAGRVGTGSIGRGAFSVYEGLDGNGVVRYIGITGRPATERFAEHMASNTARAQLRYQVVRGLDGLSVNQARYWEQTLINGYGGPKGGQLLNRINSIAPKYWAQWGIK